MATQLFLRNTSSDYGTGNNDARLNTSASAWVAKALALTRGTSFQAVSTSTVAGPTNGVERNDPGGAGVPLVWYSPPLDADVTISGSITWNIWAIESSMNANAAANGQLEVIDGATGAITLIDKTTRTIEIATSAGVNNFSETPAAGVACKKGDRLRVRIFADDSVDGNMASGFTFTLYYDGTSAATGDTYVTLTENLTFTSEPAGSQVFLTDTASAVAVTYAAASLLSSFTGSDENPLSEGGNWAKLNSSDANVVRRLSNAATGAASSAGRVYWTPSDFGPGVEAHLTYGTVSNALVFARLQGAGGAATYDGYAVEGAATAMTIYRYTNAAVSTIAGPITIPTLTSGAKIGIACHGSLIEAWYQPSGGAWTRATAVLDTTYPDAGKVGFSATNAVVLDDFYAGTSEVTFVGVAGSPVEREAWTSRGAGVQTDVVNTAAGWTSPIQVTDTAGGTVVDWFTKQLTAFTLGGAVRCNIRALASASNTAQVRVEIARVAADGTSPTAWAAGTTVAQWPNGLGTSESANSFLISGDDLAISDGQRLRIRVLIDDQGHTAMAASQTVTLYYAGTSGGASGDTYVTFTQTLTEQVAAGQVPPSPMRVYQQILAH